MRRRDLLAGLGSLGVLGSGGALLWRGPLAIGNEGPPESDGADDEDDGPTEIETIDARGSEAGSITVPSDDVMVVMFFVTGCGNCQAQMPRLAEARARVRETHGDAVTFLSVTYQSFDRMPADELGEWWRTYDGDWYVGYDAGLAQTYGVVGYPVTMVVDPDGEQRWVENGIVPADSIVDATESVLETVDTDGTDGGGDDADGNEPAANESTENRAENETNADSADERGESE